MDWGCRELQGTWKLWNLEMVCGQVIFDSFEKIFCFATKTDKDVVAKILKCKIRKVQTISCYHKQMIPLWNMNI